MIYNKSDFRKLENAIQEKEIKILKIFLYRNILQRFYNKANHHVMS